MKITWPLVIFILFCLNSIGHAQKSKVNPTPTPTMINVRLSGCVLNDVDRPEAGLVLIVDNIEVKTDENGQFDIELPSETPGSNITLTLKKQGWAVLKPFMGFTQTQNSQTNKYCVPITIAPMRSHQFLDDERLSALVAALNNAAVSVETGMQTRSEVDAARELKKQTVLADYSDLSGFAVKEILSALGERKRITDARATLREADDEYVKGNKPKAVALYLIAGTSSAGSEKAGRDQEGEQRIQVNVIMRAGTVAFEDYKFKESLSAFQVLEKQFVSGGLSKEAFRSEWLDLKYWLGRTKVQLSYEAKLDDATNSLKSAIRDYQEGLGAVPENQFLDNRAKLQYGLGTAFLALGKSRFNLKEDVPSLNSAIRAFDAAASSIEHLKKSGYSNRDLPDLLLSIGEAKHALGEKTDGRESVGYFKDAAEAADKAGNLIKAETDPLLWGRRNLNLGRAFLQLAGRTTDARKRVGYLESAVNGLQKANTTYDELANSSRNSCVSCNARALIDLGIAWGTLEQTTNTDQKVREYRKNTLAAFERAEKVIDSISREEEPFTWADLKGILGQAFSNLADKTSDPTTNADYLTRAAKAHDEAYQLLTTGYCSSCAVQSLIKLGWVWGFLGAKIRNPAKSVVYFEKAADALDKAAVTIDKLKGEGRPLTWADLKAQLGEAFYDLSGTTNDAQKTARLVDKAASSYEDAYVLANQDQCTSCAVSVLIGLGNAWIGLSEIGVNSRRTVEFRDKAVDVFNRAEKAIESVKRNAEPMSWAQARASLGAAFSFLASRSDDPTRSADYTGRAAIAYDAAATVFNSPEVTQDYCSGCAARSLIDLGNAWNTMAGTVRNPVKSAEYFDKAADAYEKADRVVSKIEVNEKRFIWASMKTELGQMFSNLANRANNPVKKASYLNKATSAYEEVSRVYEMNQDECSPCAASTLIDLGKAWDILRRTNGDKGGEYQPKVIGAFEKADKVINRLKIDEEPFNWVNLKASLGDSFSDFALGANNQADYENNLSRAAAVYDEEAKAYPTLVANQDYCSPCTTAALIRLGVAWNTLGERRRSFDNCVECFNKALVALDQAEKTVNRDANRLSWADLNLTRARALSNLAAGSDDSAKRQDYIRDAAKACEEVSNAHTGLFGSQDYCSSCAVRSTIDLANAWNVLSQLTGEPGKRSDYANKTIETLDRARKAISQIKNNKSDLMDMAALSASLGDAYSELGNGASEPGKNAEYLINAAKAYDQEAEIYATQLQNKDYCLPCAVQPLINLGLAWNNLGLRASTRGPSGEYFHKALDTFDRAAKLTSPEDKVLWADINMVRGQTLLNLARGTSDSKNRRESLYNALKCFQDSQKNYTLHDNDQQWVDVRANLVNTYLLLEDPTAALKISNELFESFPDNIVAYSSKLGVFHEGLFRFNNAFEFNKEWSERHPKEFSPQLDSAEDYFTVGRFSESIDRVKQLLGNSYTPPDVRAALHAIRIGGLLAQQSNEVSGTLDELIEEVKSRPANFRVSWVFRGTRQFVGTSKELAEHRNWLLKLLDALEEYDRDTMLRDLNDLKVKLNSQ